jgi:DNA-binding transcriptional ArsR family regulator
MLNLENKHRLMDMVSLLKALSNERRVVIMCALHKGEKSVGELEQIIGISQSALSQHLARLRKEGYVETRRDAQTIYYSLCNDMATKAFEQLCQLYGVTENGFSVNLEDGDMQEVAE